MHRPMVAQRYGIGAADGGAACHRVSDGLTLAALWPAPVPVPPPVRLRFARPARRAGLQSLPTQRPAPVSRPARDQQLRKVRA
jgi:hypothetical protein